MQPSGAGRLNYQSQPWPRFQWRRNSSKWLGGQRGLLKSWSSQFKQRMLWVFLATSYSCTNIYRTCTEKIACPWGRAFGNSRNQQWPRNAEKEIDCTRPCQSRPNGMTVFLHFWLSIGNLSFPGFSAHAQSTKHKNTPVAWGIPFDGLLSWVPEMQNGSFWIAQCGNARPPKGAPSAPRHRSALWFTFLGACITRWLKL